MHNTLTCVRTGKARPPATLLLVSSSQPEADLSLPVYIIEIISYAIIATHSLRHQHPFVTPALLDAPTISQFRPHPALLAHQPSRIHVVPSEKGSREPKTTRTYRTHGCVPSPIPPDPSQD